MLFIGIRQVSGALDTQLMLQTEDRHMSCALSELCNGIGLVLGQLMDAHLMHHAVTLLSSEHPMDNPPFQHSFSPLLDVFAFSIQGLSL